MYLPRRSAARSFPCHSGRRANRASVPARETAVPCLGRNGPCMYVPGRAVPCLARVSLDGPCRPIWLNRTVPKSRPPPRHSSGFAAALVLPNPAHPWRSDSPPPASLPSSADPSSFVLLLSHVLFLTFPFPPPDPVAPPRAPSCRREQRPVTPSCSVLLPGAAVGDPQLSTTVPGSVPDRPQAHRIWTPREEIDILTIPAPHP
ncbi:uncharacterized protein LOC125545637 isoform X1 [Triticum urartu]|uniref:uncharacterized protein LOC125545637 isoform X1 n=1 Tax=Triticum urartu TaxID=4572 RepID=UPI002043FF08|nr:uncharacterized protein LOC125545637 isoform X1 [Triticum urartu]